MQNKICRKTFGTPGIQTIFDETSYKCFYSGQLCLHKCLLKIKHLFDLYSKQEKLSSTIITNKLNKKREDSINNPSIRATPRTCGARFAAGTHLICFGRISNLQQQQPPSSAPPILNDGLINRSSPFHIRSISLTVTKSRGNSSTDEQPTSYRSSTTTNTVHIPTKQRTTMFSAPVMSSLRTSILPDNQRISTSSSSHRRLLNHFSQTNSIVSNKFYFFM